MSNGILTRLFPAQFDNHFPGQKIALWVFYALTALTLWRSQHHIFGDHGAENTAKELGLKFLGGIPLQMAIRENSDSGKPDERFWNASF